MGQTQDPPQVGSVVTFKELSNEKYVIGKILCGGMGEVYQLIPVAVVGRVLALKTYQQTSTRELFVREADLWISLGNHAHIAKAWLYLEWQFKPSIIADWYKQPIDNTVVKDWPTPKIINFTAGLLDGLEHALKVGRIIHQDIKPANILLDEEDEPRLTDFGMARFAGRRQKIGSLEGVDASMVHSVTMGPIGGTPFYMAPEVFAGQPPSVQTDIFSLGVTLYAILTGEHPYCGPETGYRLRPAFRSGPLRQFLQIRGNEASPLISLIAESLQIDPRKRPSSYNALFQLIGRKHAGRQETSTNHVREVITKAAFLRDTGRTQESLELLQAAISERPTNPELLNSYAIQLLKLGSKQRAYAVWDSAVESLMFTKGRHEHSVYVDPAVNLAWRMVAEQQFPKADALFAQTIEWCKDVPSLLHSFMEFGWWHLYNRRFEEAWQHIVTCRKSRTPDELSLWCFTLAAWLSGKFEERTDILTRAFSSVTKSEIQTALLACVIATCCSAPLRGRLIELAYPSHEDDLRGIAKDLGLAPESFRQALPHSVLRLVMRSLDVAVTGGKNDGLL
jgi:serine/threonine protein kinase